MLQGETATLTATLKLLGIISVTNIQIRQEENVLWQSICTEGSMRIILVEQQVHESFLKMFRDQCELYIQPLYKRNTKYNRLEPKCERSSIKSIKL